MTSEENSASNSCRKEQTVNTVSYWYRNNLTLKTHLPQLFLPSTSCSAQSILKDKKKRKAGETKLASEPHSDMPEMLDVSDQKFKTAVINVLRTPGWKKYILLCADLKLTLNKTERKKCLVQWALHFQGFCVHRFNQPWINDIWKRNSRKFQKSKTWICCVQATIYIAFTLYLLL